MIHRFNRPISSGLSGAPRSGIRSAGSFDSMRFRIVLLWIVAGLNRRLSGISSGHRRGSGVEPEPAPRLLGPVALQAGSHQDRPDLRAEIQGLSRIG